MKKDIILVENFYNEPHKIRDYALNELKTNNYLPYGSPSWYASKFKEWNECPFKSSESLINRLNDIVDEEIDLDFWRQGYPAHGSREDSIRNNNKSCKWNCTFHIKPLTGQKLGQGVHNHVTDTWNSVEENGWVGLIYLNPDAPIYSGLNLWNNVNPEKNYDWMTSEDNWSLIDSLGAVFNRLILCRGSRPHSGADGFSNTFEEGRLYQTFFFKTKPSTAKVYQSVSINT